MKFLPYFLVLIITFLKLCSISVHGHCLEDQKLLLLQLKQSLTFDSAMSTKLIAWNQSTSCCAWPGVSCSNGRVTGLNLRNEWISGGVGSSSALFDLQYLQKLDLSFNFFNTSIPAGLANLTRISDLNLSYAGFWGQIPIEISYLTRLVSLDLSYYAGTYYYFDGRRLKLDYPNLKKLVQNLTQLRELYLDAVDLSAQRDNWCSVLSSSLPNLEVLSLSNCLLSGPVDPSLTQLRSLSAINLSGNNLSSVPEFLSKFLNLSYLNLRYCELKGTFPSDIFLLPRLQNLELDENPLLEGSLPDSFVNTSLTTLKLRETNFSGRIPESIGNLRSLSRIELSNCNFSGPIPSSLAKLTKLVHLDLSFNMFTGSIPLFLKSKDLAHLDLSRNQLTGQISSVHWDALMNLFFVDLSNNLLNGNIPASLFASSSLQFLQLSFNQFEGQVPEFSNASSSLLKTLDLSSNKLEGHIPKSVFDIKSLNVLSLSFNKFFGNIKLEWVQNLRNLTTLDLSYNNMTIHTRSSTSSFLPHFTTLKLAACNLTQLPDLRNSTEIFNLDLSANHINGIIPSWVWEIGNKSLVSLNLSHNHFIGMEEHLSLPSLSILDLSYNHLKGNLPSLPDSIAYVDFSNNDFNYFISPDIGDSLSNTLFLSFSNNRLTGVIPRSMCSALYLRVLDLSHNYLNGTIPVCLIKASDNLAVVNLKGNSFNGIVPDEFPVNCSLRTLDLSDNHIEGKIPNSLANCITLELIVLSNNQMNDEFPCLLKNMSSLRVLILQNNSFHGNIGCPMQDHGSPQLHIIDIAVNNFRGNLPESLLLTWLAMEVEENKNFDYLKFSPFMFTNLFYEDSITITNKAVRTVMKILTTFKSVDFSCNEFTGSIPKVIGKFNDLHLLNISHNSLTGQIPSSVGGMSQLESLDLSFNQLLGAIPVQLAGLTFLGSLNLSYNQFTGEIPTGRQVQTFDESSFRGNDRLCGAPLKENCSRPDESTPVKIHSHPGKNINWVIISAQVGYVFGLGIVVGPLMLWRRWRKWYYKHVDRILFRIFPKLEERSCKYKIRVSKRRNRKLQLQR